MELFFKEPLLIKSLGLRYPTAKSNTRSSCGLYKCNCGNEFITVKQSVKSGRTKSCGCLLRSNSKLIGEVQTHGLTKTKLYRVWASMKQRCYNKKSSVYKYYGVKGIKVCDEWKDDFKAFYDWSHLNGYKEGLTIDRKENDKGYTPDNCRWVNKSIQQQNTTLIRSTNTSGYRGVSYDKTNKVYVSNICLEHKRIYLGNFKTAEKAAFAYDEYVICNNLEHPLNFEVLN